MTRTIRLAAIPGDGIGNEVVPQAVRVLNAAAELHGGVKFDFTEFPWSCRYYAEHGRMMPEDGIKTLADFEGVFLGAVGDPTVPDHVSLWGLLIPIRREFDQYVNIRPVTLMEGVTSPLRDRGAGDIDFVVVRENSEGEYSNMGGRVHGGSPYEAATQVAYFSRMGVERVVRYAAELACSRSKHLTVATKSNGIIHSMPFWDEVARDVTAEFDGLQVSYALIDALVAYFVTRPNEFDVVVASNLFGDILTDLAGAITGSIGIAPAANLNPERRFPSMFEPVHGSAPDIAGRGIANPIGQIWTAKLLLDFFGMSDVGEAVLAAIRGVVRDGIVTPDLGGTASTLEVTDGILDRLQRPAT
jgi:tartrate dehydrogenase/decarboxylase / D-malate dehydrogenase